nr:hypothetical protein [Maliibacterium massiliense]
MKKWLRFIPLALLVAVAIVLVPKACSRQVKENDPDNLSQLPYSVGAQQGDWEVYMDVRVSNEEDRAAMQAVPEGTDTAKLQDGYRTLFRIKYNGAEQITELEYTFAKGTQWGCSGTLKPVEGESSINKGLNGKDDMGGFFFSKDASIGGPIPPKAREYKLTLKGKTASGQSIKENLTLRAQ